MAVLVTLIDGSIPVAADFNTNFVNLNVEVRPVATGGTGIGSYTTGDTLYASGATTLARLPIGSIVPAPQVLSLNLAGTALAWRNIVADQTSTAVTVTSSSAETTVYTFQDSARSAGTSVVLGGTLGTANRIRLMLLGKVTNTTGGNVTFRLRVKYGATTMVDLTTANVATATTDAPVWAEIVLSASQSSASVQLMWGEYWVNSAVKTARAAATENSAADKALIATMTNSSNSASCSFVLEYAYAVVLF